jgi:hypothetical protein
MIWFFAYTLIAMFAIYFAQEKTAHRSYLLALKHLDEELNHDERLATRGVERRDPRDIVSMLKREEERK